MSKRVISIIMLILCMTLLSTCTFAGGALENRGEQRDLRLTEDMPEVKLYAERFNVSLSEAVRRLNQQDSVDDYHKLLRQNHAKVFAGLYIEHEPKYRIVVQFANDIPAGVTRDVPDSVRKDIEYRKVRFSLAELEMAQEEAMGLLFDRGLDFPSSINLSKNLVEIYASSREEGNAFLDAIDTSLAEKITITDPIVLDLPEPGVGEVQREVIAIREMEAAPGIITYEDGCLFLEKTSERYTLVWWPRLRPIVYEERGIVEIIEPNHEPLTIILNEQAVIVGGGFTEHPQGPEFDVVDGNADVGSCPPPYWLAGTVRPE